MSSSTCFEEGWNPRKEDTKGHKTHEKGRLSVPSNQVEHQEDEVKALVQRPFETLTVS